MLIVTPDLALSEFNLSQENQFGSPCYFAKQYLEYEKYYGKIRKKWFLFGTYENNQSTKYDELFKALNDESYTFLSKNKTIVTFSKRRKRLISCYIKIKDDKQQVMLETHSKRRIGRFCKENTDPLFCNAATKHLMK